MWQKADKTGQNLEKSHRPCLVRQGAELRNSSATLEDKVDWVTLQVSSSPPWPLSASTTPLFPLHAQWWLMFSYSVPDIQLWIEQSSHLGVLQQPLGNDVKFRAQFPAHVGLTRVLTAKVQLLLNLITCCVSILAAQHGVGDRYGRRRNKDLNTCSTWAWCTRCRWHWIKCFGCPLVPANVQSICGSRTCLVDLRAPLTPWSQAAFHREPRAEAHLCAAWCPSQQPQEGRLPSIHCWRRWFPETGWTFNFCTAVLFLKVILSIYLWLCWIFVAACLLLSGWCALGLLIAVASLVEHGL